MFFRKVFVKKKSEKNLMNFYFKKSEKNLSYPNNLEKNLKASLNKTKNVQVTQHLKQ